MVRRSNSLGFVSIVASSLAFATSGTLVKPLLESGWTPGAAVIARLLVAAAVLALPAALSLRGRWGLLWRARGRLVAFSVLGVALTQLAYFAAVQRIPVGTALLVEYLAPVGLVLLAWARTHRRPAGVVLSGAGLAVGGLVLVIGPGAVGGLDPLGLLYAGCAAVGLAAYWLLAAHADDGLPAIALTATSLLGGGLLLAGLAAVGLLPFAASADDVALAGLTVPWWAPVVGVAVVSTAIAYLTGIAGSVRLGSRVASFLGLSEVVFAGALSWVLLGEALAPVQLAGAVLILGGVLLVRLEPGTRPVPDPIPVPVPA